jgi:ABC-type branched-subunit amino acid transport system substrate-binding protein
MAAMRFSVWCMIFLTGCASANATTEQAPLLPLPEIGAIDGGNDLGGDADFRAISNHAASADPATARAELEGFLQHHPHHAQRPAAVSMLAALLLGQGDGAAAKVLLDENASILATPERDLLMGLCESRLGHHTQALTLLRPYLQADPPRLSGLPDALLRSLLRLALADALANAGDPGAAIDQLDLYAQVEGSRDAERAFAHARATEIAAGTKGETALAALAGHHGVFARGALGTKAAAALRAQGNEAAALKIEQETLPARRQLGLEPLPASDVPADPTHLGLVVPLSGPQARLGEVVLRGAMLVVSAAAQTGPAFQLLGRDAAAPPERSTSGGGAVGGLVSLAREDKIVGVVSTPDPRNIDTATREGLPLLLLDERSPGGQTSAFPLIHSAEARAVALARKALALGARKFAILGPETPSSNRLAAAYTKAVEEGGGTVVGHITYAASATSFTANVANLRKLSFEVLFVPDDASHLELVAPALAAADIWPRSPRSATSSARASSGRREAILESTALSVSPKLLHNAERYLQGALLCPGFYPADDARSGAFVNRFRDAYGSLPSASDAYGYDALFVLRSAVERGARSRADVLRILASQTFEGLTGDIRFGADHGRIDPPLVYVVEGDSIRLLK